MTRGRSFFRESAGLGQPPFSIKIRPITLAVYSTDIPRDELPEVLKRAVPKGYVGNSPQVIKTIDGEFLVYADDTYEFVPLGKSSGPRLPLGGYL